MRGFVKSSPHFFRRIKLAMLLTAIALLVLAVFIPSPLQEPADIGRVPNPVKSAWFLLWIQELVSYSRYLIYPVIAVAGFFLALPWLPWNPRADKTRWFPREQTVVNVITVVVFLVIIGLTIVAMFFRGKNWLFTVPF